MEPGLKSTVLVAGLILYAIWRVKSFVNGIRGLRDLMNEMAQESAAKSRWRDLPGANGATAEDGENPRHSPP
jgi:hypothetical protein